MDKKFISASKAIKKLRLAESMNVAVYVYGATGYGKTRLLKEYVDEEETLWISLLNEAEKLSELEELTSEGPVRCVVIDDLHLLRGEGTVELLINLATSKKVWLILAGRMPGPQWMTPLIADGDLIIVKEEDLCISATEISEIASTEKLYLSKERAEYLAKVSRGNAFVISMLIHWMKLGDPLNEALEAKVSEAFIKHLEMNVIPFWTMPVQEFLMKMSVVEQFTLPMAVMITGDERVAVLIEEAQSVGNFIEKKEETFYIRTELLCALKNRAKKMLGYKKYMQYVDNAGLYYEMQGDEINALKMYEISENKERLRSVLIRNGRRHFGDGHFYELRRYYLNLKEEEVKDSAVLMSALSLLYSVILNVEKSEFWYVQLKEYARKAKGGAKREANDLIFYLDIGLAHRGTVDMLDLLKRAAYLMSTGGLKLPEFNVTSNLPSAMNGAKDFCEWSKRDQFLADTVGNMIEKLLGNFGRGLKNAALCESFYEKAIDDNGVFRNAILTQMKVEGGGRLELLFVVVGMQVRLNMVIGRSDTAIQLLESFEERAIQEKKENLLSNIRAMRCWIALMTGDKKIVEDWLEEAPNEFVEFWPPERYRYLIKVFCYLQNGKNGEAIHLLEMLRYYAEANQRTYVYIETGLLLALVYRLERSEWKSIFLASLNQCCEYKFVRIISEKGAGMLPLLKKIKKEYLAQENADREWFLRVLKETTKVAERYMAYLSDEMTQPSDFGETALKVLRLQADGFNTREIAEELNISERTVKYHATENYKKLGAKGKVEAVQIAKSRNFI